MTGVQTCAPSDLIKGDTDHVAPRLAPPDLAAAVSEVRGGLAAEEESGRDDGGIVRRSEVVQGIAQGARGRHPARQRGSRRVSVGRRTARGTMTGVSADADVLQPQRALLPLPPCSEPTAVPPARSASSDPLLQGSVFAFVWVDSRIGGMLCCVIFFPHATATWGQRQVEGVLLCSE